jgi:hypothetical protein
MEDYETYQDLELSPNSFKLAFHCLPHPLFNSPSNMVLEYLYDYFHLKKSTNEFL